MTEQLAFALRNTALEQVAEHAGDDWNSEYDRIASTLPEGWQGTAEDIREYVHSHGLPLPHHHNAYGARMLALVKRGLFRDTGKMWHMRTAKSHARRTPVYQRTVRCNSPTT